MKKIFYTILTLFFLATTLSSLEAGVRVRPGFGFTFGAADTVVYQRPYVVRNYYAPAPVIVTPAPAPAPVIIQEAPVYYTETVVYPAPRPRPFSAFSFFLNFR